MRNLLFAAIAVLFSATAVQAGSYAAMAVGDGGAAYAEGNTMEQARANAVRLCRNSGYGSCSVSVAERSNWYYSAGYCDGVPYVGASPQGWWRSDEIVAIKGAADYRYDCYTILQK